MTKQERFDNRIGSLDRSLFEIMIEAEIEQDEANLATLRHHAGYLILCAVSILKRQNRLADLLELLPNREGKLLL